MKPENKAMLATIVALIVLTTVIAIIWEYPIILLYSGLVFCFALMGWIFYSNFYRVFKSQNNEKR